MLPALTLAVSLCCATSAAATAATAATAASAVYAADSVARGRADSFTVAGGVLGERLVVQVHLPPGYEAGKRYPTLYAFMGALYLGRSELTRVLDSAAAVGATPVIAVGLPNPEPIASYRSDSPEAEALRRLVADSIVSAVESRYGARRDAASRWLLGFSAGANVVFDIAVARPDVFGRVAAQSPGWMLRMPDGIIIDFAADAVRRLDAAKGLERSAFWFMWGDGEQEWERRSRVTGTEVIGALRARGAQVDEPLFIPGGHGLHQLGATLRQALSFLAGSGVS